MSIPSAPAQDTGSTDQRFHAAQRVGVFIDTQNLYHSARTLFGSHVNYKALLEGVVAGRQLVRAFGYVIKSEPGAGDESKFFDALTDLGIETRMKDLQVFYNGEKKADWDVGIAMDIVRMIEFKKLDAVVLVSGDGDFTEVLKYVRSRGVRAEVAAFKKTTSQKLLEEADFFLDLGANLRRFLIRGSKGAKSAVRSVRRAAGTDRAVAARVAGGARTMPTVARTGAARMEGAAARPITGAVRKR